MPQDAQIPFEGVLNCWNDEHDLPDLLLFIGGSAKTGILQFSNPEGDKTVHFKNGKIVFAESSSQDDGLGQFLLRTGKISLMDYTRVAKKIRPGKRFGKILVEDKILASQDLIPAVVGQVRGVLLGLFRRTETWYSFKETELPPSQSVTLDLPVARIILEGVRYVESWRRISKGVGNLDSVYRRSDAKAVEWSRMKLDARVRELLDMMEQPVSLEEICTRATLPDFEACRYLWAFRSLAWIELVDVTEQAVTENAIPMTPPPEAVITATADAPPPPASVPVEADGSPPERLVETQTSCEGHASGGSRRDVRRRSGSSRRRRLSGAKRKLPFARRSSRSSRSSTTARPKHRRMRSHRRSSRTSRRPRRRRRHSLTRPSSSSSHRLRRSPTRLRSPLSHQHRRRPTKPSSLSSHQHRRRPTKPSTAAARPNPARCRATSTAAARPNPAPPPPDQTQLAVEPPAPPPPDQTAVEHRRRPTKPSSLSSHQHRRRPTKPRSPLRHRTRHSSWWNRRLRRRRPVSSWRRSWKAEPPRPCHHRLPTTRTTLSSSRCRPLPLQRRPPPLHQDSKRSRWIRWRRKRQLRPR